MRSGQVNDEGHAKSLVRDNIQERRLTDIST